MMPSRLDRNRKYRLRATFRKGFSGLVDHFHKLTFGWLYPDRHKLPLPWKTPDEAYDAICVFYYWMCNGWSMRELFGRGRDTQLLRDWMKRLGRGGDQRKWLRKQFRDASGFLFGTTDYLLAFKRFSPVRPRTMADAAKIGDGQESIQEFDQRADGLLDPLKEGKRWKNGHKYTIVYREPGFLSLDDMVSSGKGDAEQQLAEMLSLDDRTIREKY